VNPPEATAIVESQTVVAMIGVGQVAVATLVAGAPVDVVAALLG
jgi:hypothetical protein